MLTRTTRSVRKSRPNGLQPQLPSQQIKSKLPVLRNQKHQLRVQKPMLRPRVMLLKRRPVQDQVLLTPRKPTALKQMPRQVTVAAMVLWKINLWSSMSLIYTTKMVLAISRCNGKSSSQVADGRPSTARYHNPLRRGKTMSAVRYESSFSMSMAREHLKSLRPRQPVLCKMLTISLRDFRSSVVPLSKTTPLRLTSRGSPMRTVLANSPINGNAHPMQHAGLRIKRIPSTRHCFA
mmetsp:Transcript_20810/g.48284  ORF Transcript_20810/g.48284 Transcript_20810/m.48284 type:complete len:235 (-) Transcript_20810:41-745(-)